MQKKNFLIQYISLWLPVILWAFVIFSFSSIPTAQVSQIQWKDFIIKKLAHIIEYGIFATLLYRALKNSGMEKKWAGYTAITFAFMYGISDEFHQSFTPGREPRVRDVVFDTIGASLAMYTIWNLLPKAPKRLKKLLTVLQIL